MSAKRVTYAEAMAEVEKILQRLRSGEISVDELSSDVARATRLIAECRKILSRTEAEVERLINPESKDETSDSSNS
ncbi:MAG: exodeoxyribonuclease VII small subunit [Alistipes sp.]|jgi:exodeoxyribonuclease VII small subunit|nr:exodeoxyribonuclease VII small subunit [Alistipes sp.]